MNCSSTHLTSDPTRVMFLTWQQPDSTAAALNKFCSICTPNGVYTEFGIDPISVYMTAAQNKFLRIYYARVKECLIAADTRELPED